MSDEQISDVAQDMESNMDMVQYIMLHRIYDMLTLIANKIVGVEDMDKVIKYHEMGFLLGPTPAYRPSDNSVNNESTNN